MKKKKKRIFKKGGEGLGGKKIYKTPGGVFWLGYINTKPQPPLTPEGEENINFPKRKKEGGKIFVLHIK
ncbi:hypothetical protein DVS31_11745 [Limosilactobacillus fermentum]|uniref:hypothetical protein n=1 Tax=Limosilactobacillus fermentum TaxID=1613 RepID=UPI001CFADE62|nr:hypothetical protein [Limosilactobacillus fermentum]MCB4716769.1 hypothetical protein [Limosilactobacillus fermentum]